MNNSYSESYFVDGGTLRANTPSYVKRPADDELFEALMEREFCYILTPRQMGKSSLMIRTSQRLRNENIKTAIVDIQGIGTDKVREWYASLLSQIRRGLKLSVDVDDWMKKKSAIGFGQLFVDFIQDVILTEISEQVVIFMDEVDWMIKIDFRDEFFASIRSIYNARANYDEFNRISFVLLGVASPADLISEPTRTPFNIGHAIPLQELSREDATPLENGLENVCSGEGKRILDRIFYWTSGHPYLTQKICKTIAENGKADWSDTDVDDLVNRLFLSEESRKEANLKFIQDRILSHGQYMELLKLYKQVRKSRIKENGQSIFQNQLLLSGLLTSQNGYLETRNRIYQTVFNDYWINQNTPKNWQKVALIGLGFILAMIMSIFIYDFSVGMRLNTYTVDFYASVSPSQRLSKLASIYRLRGVLSNKDSSLSASQLFYGLQRQDQLAVFTDFDGEKSKQNDLVAVVSHLYLTVANVDPENDTTELLQSMLNSLKKVEEDTETVGIKLEITSWLYGRQKYQNGNYQGALEDYGNAISLNPQNPATVYERALVYIALEDYQNVLKDLDTTISLAKESTQQDILDLTPTVTSTAAVYPTQIAMTEPPTRTYQPIASEPPGSLVDNTVVPLLTLSSSATETMALPPITQSLTPTQIPVLSDVDRFESNFSNFIEIVNAVRTLIKRTPELQSALLATDTNVSYTNLDSVGLVQAYSVVVEPTATLFVSATTIPQTSKITQATTITPATVASVVPGISSALTYSRDLSEWNINYFRPNSIDLSETPPFDTWIEPSPRGIKRLYGILNFANSTQVGVLLDILNDTDSQIVFAFDGDTDFSDNPSYTTSGSSGSLFDPIEFQITYSGGTQEPYAIKVYFPLDFAREIGAYRFHYYRASIRRGNVQIGDAAYPLAISDDNVDGDYSDLDNIDVFLDVNKDGRISDAERFGAGSPILVHSTYYIISEITPSGETIKVSEAQLGTISGTVTESLSGNAISGATIVISPLNISTVSDEDGRYSIAAPEGTYTEVSVTAPNYVPEYTRPSSPLVANGTLTINIPLQRISDVTSGTVTLEDGDSYHFLSGEMGKYTGGDFYFGFSDGKAQFWANNMYQQGLVDLGNLGNQALDTVEPPVGGYDRFGVEAIVGHTYVSPAKEGEEGHYIIFRVINLEQDKYIEIEYYYR